MSAVHIQCAAVNALTPYTHRGEPLVNVVLDLTKDQRLRAVNELLGTGMSEQEAREGLMDLFPAWFERQPAPEVSESNFGEFMAASAT